VLTGKVVEELRRIERKLRFRRLEAEAFEFLQIMVRTGVIRPRSEVARRILSASGPGEPEEA
jgi:hypothetical protein